MKTNISTCLVYIVSCALLFGLYIWYRTLVTGSLRTATLSHVDSPCLITNTRVDCRWISSKLSSIPSCRTANFTCLGRRGNNNIEMYQVLCALNPQYTLMLKQYTNSDNECSCQLLNIQDCTGISQRNLTSALWNNPPLCSRRQTTKINKEIAVSKSPLRKREAEDSLSLIVTSPTDDFIIYFTLANKNPVKVTLNAYAIDYDPLEDRIYFTAQFSTSIYSSFSNGTDKTVIATAQIDTKPRGIAVDSLARLLFYSEENRGYIALITMSTSHHKIVINNGLVKPGAMAVNMLESTLFWIDTGTKKIERAKYDGSDRRDVVNNLHNPFGLALDATNKYIYWSDGNKIWRCVLDGRDTENIHSTDLTSRFNGLSLSASHLYAIHYVTGAAARSSVYRYESDNSNETKIFEDSSQLHDIHILSSKVASKEKTICEKSHHDCSHICIPISDNKSTCLCPEELSLGTDEKTCFQIGHTETFIIIPVTVCTAIALLITIGVSVLVIKRRWLCFAKRSQDIEASAARDVDMDEGRPTTSSNEYSEIYDKIMDVFEDLTTTHPQGEEESHYLDHYNIIDLDRVSPECPIVLIHNDNKESFVQCGLDNEDYLIPVSNDGYIIPICEPHTGPQSNMDEHITLPSDSVFNVELEPEVNAPGNHTPYSSLKKESLVPEGGSMNCETNHIIISNTEATDCPIKVHNGVSRANFETEGNYYSHFVKESSYPELDPNANGHTKCTRESVAYLTLSPNNSNCSLPTRSVSSEMLPEVNDSQNYINQNFNIISDTSNYLNPLSSILSSTEPGSDKDISSYHDYECASTVPVSDKDISSYGYCECASTSSPVSALSDQNILHE